MSGNIKKYCMSGLSMGLVSAVMLSIGLHADNSTLNLDIKGQNIGSALMELGQKAGIQIMLPREITTNVKTTDLNGSYTLSAALDNMLVGSGLTYEILTDDSVIIKKDDSTENSTGLQKSKPRDSLVENIIVTASRREQNLQDVAASITSVKPEEFSDIGLNAFEDIISYTPGFNYTSFGRPRGNGTITARGVGQQGDTAVVGVYIDDVPTTSNGPLGGGSFMYLDGMLIDVERIEMLKGPQGTLYGATSIGGAVKYVSRRPSLDEFRGQASVDLSNTREGGFNKIYRGRFSAPLIEDRLGITVSAYRDDNAGFVDRVDATTGSFLKEDADGSESSGFSADLLFKFSDRFEFRGKAIRQKAIFEGISTVNSDIDRQPLFGPYTSTTALSSNKQNAEIYSGTLSYEFDGATLTSTTSRTAIDIVNLNDFGSIYGPFVDSVENNPPGTTTSVPTTNFVGSEKLVQEIHLTSESNETLEWMIGLFYTDEESNFNQSFISVPTGFDLFTARIPGDYKEYAAFGSLTYYLRPDFDITFGSRVSSIDVNVLQTASGFFASQAEPGSASDTVDTYLLAARYRPTEDVSLYARIASGYRPAFANLALIDVSTGENVAPPLINSDTLWSYEVGAKGSLLNDLISYDMALWYIDWQEFQAQITVGGAAFRGNAEHGITANGVEGTFTLHPVDGLSVISTFSYANSTLNEDESLLNGLAGQRVPGVPRWTASTRIRYDFSLMSSLDAHVGGGFRYAGASSSAFVDGDAGDSGLNIPSDSYTLVDLNAGVVSGGVSVKLYITNLFNDSSLHSGFGFAFPGSDPLVTLVPVRPRTIGAAISYDF